MFQTPPQPGVTMLCRPGRLVPLVLWFYVDSMSSEAARTLFQRHSGCFRELHSAVSVEQA